jgi:hypothetical protein
MTMVNLMRKTTATPTLPAVKTIEQEFAQELATAPPPRLVGSGGMERVKELVTSGLTAAYKDGAAALEATIREANEQVAQMQEQCKAQIAELDEMKRACAEYLAEHTRVAKALTDRVQASVEQLRVMTRLTEEQCMAIKQPPSKLLLQSPEEPTEEKKVD